MALGQIGHDLQGIDGDQMARRNGRAVDDIVKGLQGNGADVIIGMSGIGFLDVLQGFLDDERCQGLLPFRIGLAADLVKGRRRDVFRLLLQFR